MVDQKEEWAKLVATKLQEIVEEFSDEIGRKPSIAELFEILRLGIISINNEALLDVHPANVLALKPQLKRQVKQQNLRASQGQAQLEVASLNDAPFVIANDLFVDLTDAIRQQRGTAPTVKEICQLLVEGLHNCEDNLLNDVGLSQITGVKAEIRKQKKISSKVGDIIAIPARNVEYFIAVILAKNQFGVAYGFFKGTNKLKPLSISSHPPVEPHPIYSGESSIASGSWKIIGHDEDLLSLFPADPEIYHYQHEDKPNPALGPYGSGETASGRLRHLTKEEAEELGLLSDKYSQFYLPEILEEHLNATLRK